MEGQTGNSKKRKQTNGQPTVVCNWSYSKETTPAFRRLLTRLVRPRKEQKDKKGL